MNNAVLIFYVLYTSFFMCLHISKSYFKITHVFACFVLTLRLTSWQLFLSFNQFVRFNLCDGEYHTIRSAMELHIGHDLLKRSFLKVFETIRKSQHRRFQSKLRRYWKFKIVYFSMFIYGTATHNWLCNVYVYKLLNMRKPNFVYRNMWEKKKRLFIKVYPFFIYLFTFFLLRRFIYIYI